MQRLKKILGYWCIVECIAGAGLAMMPQLPSDIKWLVPAGCVMFAMYAYYLLKKTPNKVSPIRIFFGVGCLGDCILSICLIFNPPAEPLPTKIPLFTPILFGVLAFWLLHGFKRRRPAENQTEPKVNDIKLEQINNSSNTMQEKNNNDLHRLSLRKILGFIFLFTFFLGIYMTATETQEQLGANIAASVFCLVISILLLKKPQTAEQSTEIYTDSDNTNQSAHIYNTQTETPSQNIISVNITPSSVPQETINAMREAYSPMQADNDMRILQDSIQILQKTTNLETFFSRYEIAMEKALTLKQAKQAGIPINLNVSSQAIAAYKHQRLAQLLPIIYKKEIQSINDLKTIKGKLNRLDKFSELLNKYAVELEFVPGYNEILDSIATIKQNLN